MFNFGVAKKELRKILALMFRLKVLGRMSLLIFYRILQQNSVEFSICEFPVCKEIITPMSRYVHH